MLLKHHLDKAGEAYRQKLDAAWARARPDASPEARLRFAETFYFWVLTFQDVLRLARTLIADREMRRVATLIRAEDRGHDRWYLADMETLGSAKTVRWLWSKEHEKTREASYEVIALVHRVHFDVSLLTILYALELAGRDFFPRAAKVFEDRQAELTWFSERHVEAEEGHTIHRPGDLVEHMDCGEGCGAAEEAVAAAHVAYAAMARIVCHAISHLEDKTP